MLAPLHPADAYRRVDFEARVKGADPRDLTMLCYERLDAALGRALLADERNRGADRSKALTDALTALTALQLGLDRGHALAAAFDQLFAGARRELLKCVPTFDMTAMRTLQQDFRDVANALSMT